MCLPRAGRPRSGAPAGCEGADVLLGQRRDRATARRQDRDSLLVRRPDLDRELFAIRRPAWELAGALAAGGDALAATLRVGVRDPDPADAVLQPRVGDPLPIDGPGRLACRTARRVDQQRRAPARRLDGEDLADAVRGA